MWPLKKQPTVRNADGSDPGKRQPLPVIPSAYADPIETGPLTDDERSVSTWSPAQAKAYRGAA